MKMVLTSSGTSESDEQAAGVSTSGNGRDFDVVLGKWLKASGTGKTEAEVRDLTERIVGEFVTAAAESTRFGWIVPGKQVCGYVKLLQPEGPGSRPDPYDLLASHPDIPYAASHLRNLAEAYELWESFGGEGKAPKLGIGFFTLVLNRALDRGEKERLLNESLKNQWSTRQLKAAVKAFVAGDKGSGRETPSAGPVPSDWADLTDPVKKINSILIGLRSQRPVDPIPCKTVEELKALAASISEILKAYDNMEAKVV